ncbi:MAG: PLDc N-terminal domain-containing protein [Streptosporangiaceae bacterium]
MSLPQAGSGHLLLHALPVLIPLLVLVLGLDVYCLVNLVHAKSVRSAPRVVWVIVILFIHPIGSILYLFLGADGTAAGPRAEPVRGWWAPLRWLAALIRNLVFVVSGIPVQLAGLALLALPWLLPHYVPVGFWLVLATFALSAGLVLLARVPLTVVQRHRCWSVLGVEIPSPPTACGPSLWPRLGNSLRSEATWRHSSTGWRPCRRAGRGS